MASLMVRNDPLLVRRQQLALLLQTGNHTLNGLFKVVNVHKRLAVTRSNQRSLVTAVGDVCSGKSRRHRGQSSLQILKINIVLQLQTAQMNSKDLLTARKLRVVQVDLSVESSWSQQSRVQNVCSVCTGQNNNVVRRGKSIHLDQQLVQRVFSLVVATGSTALGTRLSNGVDLVHENDRRCVFSCSLEQLPNSGSTNTNKHLHKLRARNTVERNTGLSSSRLGQHRLTSSWGTGQNGSSWDLGSQTLVLLWALQKLDKLHDLLLGLVASSHVVEFDLDALFRIESLELLGVVAKQSVSKSLRTTQQLSRRPNNESKQQQRWQDVVECFEKRSVLNIHHRKSQILRNVVFFLCMFQLLLKILHRTNCEVVLGSRIMNRLVLPQLVHDHTNKVVVHHNQFLNIPLVQQRGAEILPRDLSLVGLE
ncbi:hypothetical protein OGAPHI_002782 [Ogataea philodendri]|uniref:Uncharacterized protein n=1 Tax=Ogataea philodendri TaxID=1378263 RepID=A0A9P8P7C9_9ASCO|nr:uncharacterized protein OGAPHI_002782 [Ogataea philodendri]KAH3667133.1 hypothetical protein OGAPHI_002782 [Ogataea philodendri]